MSRRLIFHSPDLRQLIEEGFELEIRGPYLLVHHVPYVKATSEIGFGTLVMALTLAGDETARPDDHTAMFIGQEPCDAHGQRLSRLVNGGRRDLGDGITVDFSFSAKPPDGYRDFHHKVTAYVARLAGPATEIDAPVTARTFEVLEEAPEDSPFRYADTATPLADLERYAERLSTLRVAVVGVGGTGSYIVDLLAKTSIAEIHLYDGDQFLQHNAFRAPGAARIPEMRGAPNKAQYWVRMYRHMRRRIRAHPVMVTEANVGELRRFDFVFIAIDDGRSRRMIIDALERFGVPFVDVGLGVNDVDNRLSATMRLSTGTPDHRVDRARLPVDAAGPENDYRHNIQIVELNALNAALAVVKFKKVVGVYADLEKEHHATYSTAVNAMVNRDRE
jgi:hypothetical protein